MRPTRCLLLKSFIRRMSLVFDSCLIIFRNQTFNIMRPIYSHITSTFIVITLLKYLLQITTIIIIVGKIAPPPTALVDINKPLAVELFISIYNGGPVRDLDHQRNGFIGSLTFIRNAPFF